MYTLTIFKNPQKVSKMVANDLFLVSHHFNFGKNMKNHFPIGIFNEIWVIIGEYEYINIDEIKIVKGFSKVFYPLVEFCWKSYFPAPRKCYAN